MNGPPALPARVSANGAELWDWAASFSNWTQRQARMRELRADIGRLRRECGSCRYWMQSRNCPRERADGSGFSRGPSMAAPICSKFEITPHAAECVANKQAELSSLQAQVDTLPKGRDAKQGSVGTKGSAVAEGHAPNPPSPSHIPLMNKDEVQ